MRRKDREITDEGKIREIIEGCHCMRLGFCDEGQVYIVPLNFGLEVENGQYTFYFHGAREGRKIDLIHKNPYVGFEMDRNFLLKESEKACNYSARFQSVIGNGSVRILEDVEEKKKGLQAIMKQNTGKEDWEFIEAAVNAACVFEMKVEQLSCKEHE